MLLPALMHTSRIAITLALSLAATSCGVGSQSFHEFASPTVLKTSAALEAQSPPRSPCDVRLFVEQLPGHHVDGVEKGALGAVIVERTATGLANGVCIKQPGKQLELPASMLIAAAPDGPRLGRFCADDQKSDLPFEGNGKSVPVNYCTWNGIRLDHSRSRC